MSTFWKPRPNVGPHTPGSPVTKVLGHMVYVLWCRCDLCFASGPSTWYHMWERGQQTSQLCDQCDDQVLAAGELVKDGWSRVG